jgi:hypothetical protein
MLKGDFVFVCMHHILNNIYSNGVCVETVDLDCRCLCCKTSYTAQQNTAAATTLTETDTAAQRKRSSLLRSSKAAATAAVRDTAVISSDAVTSKEENIQPVYSNSNDSSTAVKSKAKCPSCETCTGPQELFFNPTEENVTEELLQQSKHSRSNSKSSSNDKSSSKCCSCECSSCHCANSSNSAQRKGQYIRL